MKTRENMSGWTEERASLAAKLYSEGKSASEVGKVLGVSRNAVIGKMHRMGVLGHYKRNQRGEAAQKPRPRSAPSAPRKIAAASHTPSKPRATELGNGLHITAKLPSVPMTPRLEVIPPTARPWTERHENECSWPVAGEGADTISCCRPVAGRWCAEHNAIGCIKPETDAKSLFRALRRAVA